MESRKRVLKNLGGEEYRRWVIEDLALIYVIECSAYIFLYEFYRFWPITAACGCNHSATERSHPTSEVRGRSRKDPMP